MNRELTTKAAYSCEQIAHHKAAYSSEQIAHHKAASSCEQIAHHKAAYSSEQRGHHQSSLMAKQAVVQEYCLCSLPVIYIYFGHISQVITNSAAKKF